MDELMPATRDLLCVTNENAVSLSSSAGRRRAGERAHLRVDGDRHRGVLLLGQLVLLDERDLALLDVDRVHALCARKLAQVSRGNELGGARGRGLESGTHEAVLDAGPAAAAASCEYDRVVAGEGDRVDGEADVERERRLGGRARFGREGGGRGLGGHGGG